VTKSAQLSDLTRNHFQGTSEAEKQPIMFWNQRLGNRLNKSKTVMKDRLETYIICWCYSATT